MTRTWFVGVDWGSETHHVCVLDRDGKVRGERAFDHSGKGLAAMADWLLGHTRPTSPDEIGVAIEVPHGPVVETLLERGFAVHSINPKQLDRFRDRFSVAGAKDDRRDARVLAAALRTDPECLNRVQPSDAAIVMLREVSRARKQLVNQKNRLENQVRDQLWRYYPQFLAVVKNEVSAPFALALWRLAPTPGKARRLREATLAKLLKEHRIRRLTSAQLRDQLRAEPIAVSPDTVKAAVEHIGLLRPVLDTVCRQLADADKRLERMTRALEAPAQRENDDDSPKPSDAAILRSLPGLGKVGLATLLSEADQSLGRRDHEALRCLCGVAPVTVKSGKKLIVMRRLAANEHLSDAVYHWGRVAIQHDPISRAKYDAMKAQGKTHGRAIRQLVDRLLGVACAMLRGRLSSTPTSDAMPRSHDLPDPQQPPQNTLAKGWRVPASLAASRLVAQAHPLQHARDEQRPHQGGIGGNFGEAAAFGGGDELAPGHPFAVAAAGEAAPMLRFRADADAVAEALGIGFFAVPARRRLEIRRDLLRPVPRHAAADREDAEPYSAGDEVRVVLQVEEGIEANRRQPALAARPIEQREVESDLRVRERGHIDGDATAPGGGKHTAHRPVLARLRLRR